MFTNSLFLLLDTGSGYAMAAVIGCNLPIVLHLCRLVAFLRRRRQYFTKQLASRLVPITVGKIVRISLIDEGNFTGALCDLFGGGGAQARAMYCDFAERPL